MQCWPCSSKKQHDVTPGRAIPGRGFSFSSRSTEHETRHSSAIRGRIECCFGHPYAASVHCTGSGNSSAISAFTYLPVTTATSDLRSNEAGGSPDQRIPEVLVRGKRRIHGRWHIRPCRR